MADYPISPSIYPALTLSVCIPLTAFILIICILGVFSFITCKHCICLKVKLSSQTAGQSEFLMPLSIILYLQPIVMQQLRWIHHFVSDWSIHGIQRMNPTDSGDPLAFPQLPLWHWHFNKKVSTTTEQIAKKLRAKDSNSNDFGDSWLFI